MCGIAGLFGIDAGADRHGHQVRRMLARIGHRGPDGIGFYHDDHAAIGTARLSIIDVAGGDQPIGDAGERWWIAFNGEIYNHVELRLELNALGYRFATRSDTEVLLQGWVAWGEAVLSRLDGPFAAAIWDRAARRLVLVRDLFGERPLFYARHGRGLVFGSEIKCFLETDAVALAFDPDRLRSIYRTWVPLEHESCFKGVHQLPAGGILTAGAREVAVRRWAELPLNVPRTDLSRDEAAQATREALERSVRVRLRSDVEVGTYLSGGLDSAIVTSLAVEQASRPVRTFSVSFADAAFDESADQRLVADHLATDHVSLRVGDRDIVDAFPDALRHAEVPVFRSAFVPMYLLSREARAHGVKVVLTGEGADEAFAGYDIFKETLLREAWPKLDRAARLERLARLYPYLAGWSGENRHALYAWFGRSTDEARSDLFSHDLRFRSAQLSVRLLRDGDDGNDGLGSLRRLVEGHRAAFDRYDGTRRAQWLEFNTLLGGYLLSTQGDRMALAHGVENRCPFLNTDVVRWGAATNGVFDNGWDEKHVLKQAFRSRLPTRSTSRPKQPYLAPDAAAFVSMRPDYLELILSERELGKVDVLDPRFCTRLSAKLLADGARPPTQAESHAFLFLVSTALLHRDFVERPPGPPAAPAIIRAVDGRTLGVAG